MEENRQVIEAGPTCDGGGYVGSTPTLNPTGGGASEGGYLISVSAPG